MKFIEKIKNLFKERPKVLNLVKPEIKDIDNWIKDNMNNTNKTLNKRAFLVYSEIEEIMKKIDQDLIILESVNLSERKTIDKIKQITEIGKEELTESIKKLLINLRKQKENPSILEIKDKLNLFYRSSAKSHFKATQLIGKEIENLTDSITKIRRLIENFTNENSKLIKNKELLINLNNIDIIRKEKEKTKDELINLIKEKTGYKFKEELGEISKEIEKIENSQEYKEKINLLNEKNKKQERLREIEFKIIESIDQKILEKYIRIKDENKTAKEYLKNPVIALINDNELKIIEINEEMKGMIKDKRILVKEPEKTIKKLRIEKKELLNLKDRVRVLKEEIISTKEKIEKIQISPKPLLIEKIRIEDKIKENTNDLENLDKKYNKLSKEIEILNTEILSGIDQSKKL